MPAARSNTAPLGAVVSSQYIASLRSPEKVTKVSAINSQPQVLRISFVLRKAQCFLLRKDSQLSLNAPFFFSESNAFRREIQDMRRSSEIITNVERLKQQQMAEALLHGG